MLADEPSGKKKTAKPLLAEPVFKPNSREDRTNAARGVPLKTEPSCTDTEHRGTGKEFVSNRIGIPILYTIICFVKVEERWAWLPLGVWLYRCLSIAVWGTHRQAVSRKSSSYSDPPRRSWSHQLNFKLPKSGSGSDPVIPR